MEIRSDSFENGGRIPAEFAFAKADPATHATFSDNRSPHLAWSGVPEGTRSLALLCVDSDVPTVGDDVNQEGRSVPADLPRTEFTHWLMVDVAPDLREFAVGECGAGVVSGGKDTPPGPGGSRQGVNDYTGWFAGDTDLGGTYLGFDGPAPPWNDELLHHYHFEVYALDVERLDVGGEFTLAEVRAAMEGHILDRAEIVGTYTQNPDLL